MTTVLLTADDLSKRWGIPKSSIWRYTRDGTIPRVKIGGHYRYRLDAIETFEQAGGMDGAG